MIRSGCHCWVRFRKKTQVIVSTKRLVLSLLHLNPINNLRYFASSTNTFFFFFNSLIFLIYTEPYPVVTALETSDCTSVLNRAQQQVLLLWFNKSWISKTVWLPPRLLHQKQPIMDALGVLYWLLLLFFSLLFIIFHLSLLFVCVFTYLGDLSSSLAWFSLREHADCALMSYTLKLYFDKNMLDNKIRDVLTQQQCTWDITAFIDPIL